MKTFFKHHKNTIKGTKKLRHSTNSLLFERAHGSKTDKAAPSSPINLIKFGKSSAFTIEQNLDYYCEQLSNAALKSHSYYPVFHFNNFVLNNASFINIQ